MKTDNRQFIKDYLDRIRDKKRRKRVIAALSLIVGISVVLNMMQPASTLVTATVCGFEEHAHAEDCFADGVLVCGLPEHIHTDACHVKADNEEQTVVDFNDAVVAASAVDERVGEQDGLSLDELEEDAGLPELSDEIAVDGAYDPLEAYIVTEAEEIRAGEPVAFEFIHFGGAEPATQAVTVRQGEAVLLESEKIGDGATVIPEGNEAITVTLIVTDDLGNTITTESTIPGTETEEEQTEVEIENAELTEEAPDEPVVEVTSGAIEEIVEEIKEQTEVGEESGAQVSFEDAEEADDVITDEIEQDVQIEEPADAPAGDEEAAEEDAGNESNIEGQPADEDAADANVEEQGEADSEEEDAAEKAVEEEKIEEVDEETEAEESGEETAGVSELTYESEGFALKLRWNSAASEMDADAESDADAEEAETAVLKVDEIDAEAYAACVKAAEALLNPVEEAVAEESAEESIIEETGEERYTEENDIDETDAEDADIGENNIEETEAQNEVEAAAPAFAEARFFTVTVAQGEEEFLPEGGALTLTVDDDSAVLLRVDDALAISEDGAWVNYAGEILGFVVPAADEAEPEAEEVQAEESEAEAEAEPEEEAPAYAEALGYEGDGFTVTLTCGADAQIPEDATLDVREILPGTEEYSLYSAQTETTLDEAWHEAVAQPRFFDITILYNEEEIQPAAPVSVRIDLDEAVSVPEDASAEAEAVQAIHFADEGAQLLSADSEQPEQAAEAISFDAESFSVYGIVPTAALTQKVITAEGETFDISVTYTKDANIPEGATLAAAEITAESDPEKYENYTALSAAALTGDPAAALALARLFDIRIVAGEGEEQTKVEPADTVAVEIRMEAAEAASEVETHVVHFAEADTQVITPESTTDESGMDVLSFETESFSMYEVVQILSETEAALLNGQIFRISNLDGVYLKAEAKTDNDWWNGQNNKDFAHLQATNDVNGGAEWTFEWIEGYEFAVYTMVGGERKYLKFSYKGTNDGKVCSLELSDAETRVHVAAADQGHYRIHQQLEDGNNYYLNLDWGHQNNGFLGWHGDTNENGTKVNLTPVAVATPDLDGKTFAIISDKTFPDENNKAVVNARAMLAEVVVDENNNNKKLAGYTVNIFAGQKTIDLPDNAWWTFTRRDDGTYYIRSGDKYLKMEDNNKGEITDNPQQSFEVIPNGDGTYYLRAKGTKICVNLSGGNANSDFAGWEGENDPGSKMLLYAKTDNNSTMTGLAGMQFAIVSAKNPHALQATSTSDNGWCGSQAVTVETDGVNNVFTGSSVALWTFEDAGTGQYYLKTDNGQYLSKNGDNGNNLALGTEKTPVVVEQGTGGRVTMRFADTSHYIMYQTGSGFHNWPRGGTHDNAEDDWLYLCTPAQTYTAGGEVAIVSQMITQGVRHQQLAVSAERSNINGNRLNSTAVLVWPTSDGDGKYHLYGADNMGQWRFTPVGDGTYYISTNIDGYEQFLGFDNDGRRKFSLLPGNAHRFRLDFMENQSVEVDDTTTDTQARGATATLTYLYDVDMGKYLGLESYPDLNYGFYPLNDAKELGFYLYTLAEQNHPIQKFDRISSPDLETMVGSPGNDVQVIMYYKVYRKNQDGTTNTQDFDCYAIDRDGSLVPVLESGSTMYYLVDDARDIVWSMTTANGGYYHLANDHGTDTVYFCPTSDGYITSSTVTDQNGVRLNPTSVADALPYAAQLWGYDSAAGAYYGVKLGDENAMNTVLAGNDTELLFAYQTSVKPLNTVPTVDSYNDPSKRITMKMYDFTKDEIYAAINCSGFNGAGEWGLVGNQLYDNGFPNALYQNSTGFAGLFDDSHFRGLANHLFIKSTYDETGYYEYDSSWNYAFFKNENDASEGGVTDFKVYQQLGIPTDGFHNSAYLHGNFLPYNSLEEAGRKPSTRNLNLIDENEDKFGEDHPRLGEDLYLIDNTDYHFGMVFETQFYQPAGGIDDHGNKIIFEFNGDDDLWVFIDGKLALDIGGDHDPRGGRINFADGTVTYLDPVSDYKGTLKDANGNDITEATKESHTVKFSDLGLVQSGTFADYTTHTMKVFYMERGGGASNLHIKFNIMPCNEETFILKKKLEGVNSEFANKQFAFKAYLNRITDGAGNYGDKTLITSRTYTGTEDQPYVVEKGAGNQKT